MNEMFRGRTKDEWLGDIYDETVQYMVVLLEMIYSESNYVYVGLANNHLYIYSEEMFIERVVVDMVQLTNLDGYTFLESVEDFPNDLEKLVWSVNDYEE